MTEKSARPRHSYRQNKGWKLTGTELLCLSPLNSPAPFCPSLHPRRLIAGKYVTWAPRPLVSSCAWPLGDTCERLEDRKKGSQPHGTTALPVASVQTATAVLHTLCGSPFQTRQVPSATIRLPWCPNPGQPSIRGLFIQLSSITHFECVICFLLGI